MDIGELKRSGRENIIRVAVERMKENFPDFKADDPRNVKVRASNRTVHVILGMSFMADGKKGARSFQKVDHEVFFSKEGVTCYPMEHRKNLELADEDQGKIDFLKNTIGMSLTDHISIQEKEGHFEVTVSHGAEGGAECYKVDKETGGQEMLWHEHPMPRDKYEMTDLEGNVIEEEEEVFEEITD